MNKIGNRKKISASLEVFVTIMAEESIAIMLSAFRLWDEKFSSMLRLDFVENFSMESQLKSMEILQIFHQSSVKAKPTK